MLGRTNQAKENEEKLATLKRREERQREEAEKKRKEAELRMRQAEERRRKEEEERKAKAEEEAARVRYIKRYGIHIWDTSRGVVDTSVDPLWSAIRHSCWFLGPKYRLPPVFDFSLLFSFTVLL